MRIRIENLAKQFGTAQVLSDISLTLAPGGIAVLIGLNGAGKSTVLRCLAGICAPTAGRILMDEVAFVRGDVALKKRQLFLPDVPSFLPDFTALDHLAMLMRLYDREAAVDAAAVVAILRELDVLDKAKSPLKSLSRGQSYKIALAGLILVDPELWLLDEPFASGMDPQGMAVFKAHARRAVARGATLVYTTQILEIAEKFATDLIVLDRGRVRLALDRDALAALQPAGPGSLTDRLREFREIPT